MTLEVIKITLLEKVDEYESCYNMPKMGCTSIWGIMHS